MTEFRHFLISFLNLLKNIQKFESGDESRKPHIGKDNMELIQKITKQILVMAGHNCDHWYTDSDRCCAKCDNFVTYKPTRSNSQELDFVYVCAYRHYIKHAHSGCCDDYVVKFEVNESVGTKNT